MALHIVPLASGSKGNATLIFSNSGALLVDAGLTYSKIKEELRKFDLTPSMLDGVVITHEHADHIKGLVRLSAECKVYAHPLTQKELYNRAGDVKNFAEVDDFEAGFTVGDIAVQPFRIPHDAVYPLAYSFSSGGSRCSVATDIGVPTRGVLRNIWDSQVVLLEANHDVTMLKEGSYPERLKARILSNNGHLSNDSAGRIACLLTDGSCVERLILAHISQNNNTEQLAYDCVSAALAEHGKRKMELGVAHQDRQSEEIDI